MKKLLEMADYTDLFLYDMKHMDPVRHNELTGISNEKILANLRELLVRGYKVQIRMPMLKMINDSHEEIKEIVDFYFLTRNCRILRGSICCRTISWASINTAS